MRPIKLSRPILVLSPLLLVALTGCEQSVVNLEEVDARNEMPALQATSLYTDPAVFNAAVAHLGESTAINLEDIDASPVNNTWVGREEFDGAYYAGQGFTFANPYDYPLFVSPGGLFWNASNSISVKQFPFDDNAADDTDDDLIVSLDPACAAVGFVLVDNATHQEDEFVEFIDSDGAVVQKAGLPYDFTPFRAFLGVVSEERPIAGINIVEAPNDGDDVNYDDFVCYPGVTRVEIDIKPGSDPNAVNCNDGNGVVTVAILTSVDFDAGVVDHTTVTFEGASEIHIDRKTGDARRHAEDVDYDGDVDLVFHFRLEDTGLGCDAVEGTLEGDTFDGQRIRGADAIRMVIESVTGNGSFYWEEGEQWRTFAFTAHRFSDGTIGGQWERVNHVDEAETKSHGVVTCFAVDGNQAWLGGYATSGLYSTPPNNEVGWLVVDNGQGENSLPDQISLQSVSGGEGFADRYCASTAMRQLFDVEAGNIQVER